MIPLINGQAYDFGQIIVNVMGVPIPSVTSIEYQEEQEKTNNFGAGRRPISRGHGTINATASIEMSMTDVESIRDAAPNGSLLAIPSFDIVVVFGNPQSPKKHTLKNCEFTVDGFSGSLDDTDLTKSFDLVVSHIEFK
jgi:hypothetical protein